MVRKILLGCGIVSSVLYVATILLAPRRWEGYSSSSQTVSELFAINAPTKPLVVPLFLMYSVLVIAFGMGVWASADRKGSPWLCGDAILPDTPAWGQGNAYR